MFNFIKSNKIDFTLKSGSRIGEKGVDYGMQRMGKKGVGYGMQRMGKKGADSAHNPPKGVGEHMMIYDDIYYYGVGEAIYHNT